MVAASPWRPIVAVTPVTRLNATMSESVLFCVRSAPKAAFEKVGLR